MAARFMSLPINKSGFVRFLPLFVMIIMIIGISTGVALSKRANTLSASADQKLSFSVTPMPSVSATPSATVAGVTLSPSQQPTVKGSPKRAASSSPSPSTTVSQLPTNTSVPAAKFALLPPGSALPSDADCTARVKRTQWEPRPQNAIANQTKGVSGTQLKAFGGPNFGYDARMDDLKNRVSGNFTGTTDEILQWTACKWGFEEDFVRAQAAKESWWVQSTSGDWGAKVATECPAESTTETREGAFGCYESYSLLQSRGLISPLFPNTKRSSAFGSDYAYMVMRGCYEGYERWLNDVEHVGTYSSGDLWGCVGRWYAGRWHTAPAEDYITKVKGYLNSRIWCTPDFNYGKPAGGSSC